MKRWRVATTLLVLLSVLADRHKVRGHAHEISTCKDLPTQVDVTVNRLQGSENSATNQGNVISRNEHGDKFYVLIYS